MYYTISQVAKKLNMSPHTLRFYAKEGLLPFVERGPHGIRRFQEKDLEYLLLIDFLKKAGLSLKEIRTFIDLAMQGNDTVSQRRAIFTTHRQRIECEIQRLSDILDGLKYKEWYYQQAEQIGIDAARNTITGETIPPEIRPFYRKFLQMIQLPPRTKPDANKQASAVGEKK